ncbi:demethylmenaquinone methyltransferase [Candidatus Koribacter versatilis Ellin345]|uniref:Demethylmenaquinone methyltransferase n=2 Tax=Candidatus Korobacter versatilis TaxID=658062 RepID=Q1IR76_KORVE|nr:demethylmenaquinone methyltransferase [Candidatus Koribacter versatilis Ellin345]
MMGRPMTEAIVAAADIRPGLRVLDVASGTGEPAISIATALNATGRVIATDISSEPLTIGEQRAHERGLTNIEFQHADVHDLPFPDNSFDLVTSRLGAMFFADINQALREIHRVLTIGGRATLLAWGPMDQGYFSTTVGTIVKIVPDLRVPDSGKKMFKFGEPETLAKALRTSGFGHVEEAQEEVPWNWPGTPDDLWSYFQDVTAPFKPLFQSVPEASRKEVDQAVLSELHKRYDGEFVRFNAKIVLASAIK